MTRYKQKNKYESTELDGEWIILNTDNYTITQLNTVGGICWEMLSVAQTVETMTQSIMDQFKMNQENKMDVKGDIEKFLSNLFKCGLIQICY